MKQFRVNVTSLQEVRMVLSDLLSWMAVGLRGKQRAADPDDPPAGEFVIWQSDGTGTGDDGDILIKITDSGGTTATGTLVDYSVM